MCGPFEDADAAARRTLVNDLEQIKRTTPRDRKVSACLQALSKYADDWDVDAHLKRLGLSEYVARKGTKA